MGNLIKRTKLKDIAEQLGVSITTVSRALNNKADINEQTKREILELANKLGYRPNSLAVSLRRNKNTTLVGVILPIINHYFFSTVLKGIMSKAHLNNSLIIVGESLQNPQKEKEILNQFMDQGVSGIIISSSNNSSFDENIIPLLHKRIPIVIIDRMYDNYEGNYVLTNDFGGAYKAVQHLLDNGYKRIAHIGSTDDISIGLERKRGYIAALNDAGFTSINEEYVILNDIDNPDFAIEKGFNATAELFKLKNPPDAIFAVTDDLAIGVIEYARENNIAIPDELGLVGFSNSQISNYVRPRLSTVEQNGFEMGQLAFDYFKKASTSNGAVFQKVFELDLIIRESSVRNR